MADGISFDVSLSLNCTKVEEDLRNRTLNFQILEVRVRSVCSAFLSYSQEMDVASSEGD